MNPLCILHVEDEPNDVWLLKRAFRKAGIANPIELATDGQEAIDYLAGKPPYHDRARYPLPCMVLLDLYLPRVPGLAVLEWIRQESALAGMVVVLYSAEAHPGDVARAAALGANCVLRKPMDFRQSVDVARLIQTWWLRSSRSPPVGSPHLRPVFCHY
jgi:CheY-like chemotaxis protein